VAIRNAVEEVVNNRQMVFDPANCFQYALRRG
jgi:hypothetical protein